MECTIENGPAAAPTPNHSAGTLEFTEVTVTKPANCTAHSVGAVNGTITTTALTDTVIMDPVAGSTAVFDKFFSDTGALAHIEFTGALCPLDEVVATLAGTVTGRMVFQNGTENDHGARTGEQRVIQSFTFNAAEQSTGGGSLTLGANAAILDATVDVSLNGVNAGKNWGSD